MFKVAKEVYTNILALPGDILEFVQSMKFAYSPNLFAHIFLHLVH